MASFKKFIFLASVAGVTVAGVSYALKYRKYQKELEGEFTEFDKDDTKNNSSNDRKYTALKATTDEFVLAAKDTANGAKGMASAAKEMIKDVANIITDNVTSAGDVARDNAKPIIDKAKATAKPVVEEAKKVTEPIIDKVKETFKEDDDVDSYETVKVKDAFDEDDDVEVDFYEINIDDDDEKSVDDMSNEDDW